MRFSYFAVPALAVLALGLGAARAEAASCSSFVVIKSYDAAAGKVVVDHGKGSLSRFFPRPEGTPANNQRVPKSCTGKVTKQTEFEVKPTGGKLTVTQIRSNFDGKMLNEADDAAWFASQIEKLVTDGTEVVAVIRPGLGKDAALGVTTIYLPITEAERAEIERLENQGEDL